MDASNLKPGDDHYMAYVGYAAQYDFMGATQFRLLTTLGLRAHHSLLDVGCGSLRPGRLFIPYLDKGHYCGIEPNTWLIEEAINNQLGKDLIELKAPRFDHNIDFKTDVFSQQFDFILAQSIFSHTGSALLCAALRNFKDSLTPDGLIVVTFVEASEDSTESGWVYPGCCTYHRSTIKGFAKEAGLFAVRLPWYNPRQTWYVLSKDKSRLPKKTMLRHLKGAVFFDPEFFESWKLIPCMMWKIKTFLIRTLPRPMKERLEEIVKNRKRN